ncbi:serine/threonine-protein kinase 54-like [Bidens hawaiensis]|uniref:serine/threonine-protein kinase 54-like n=1 Tax=Bidens hawaiensis TaxID=980011 RepID=UPI0040495C8B
MEELQKAIDGMNHLQIAHNHFLRSPPKHQFIQPWQETLDPLKLVLGKVIGRGSFGVVHKGSYDGQTVAAKILDFGNTRVTEALMECMKDDFMKEACLWQNLDHPNVTKEIYCCDMAYTYDLDNIPADIYNEMRPRIPVDCPRSLAQLIERCWDTNPKKRPEMKDVVLELEEIIKTEGWQTSSKIHNGANGCFKFFNRVI